MRVITYKHVNECEFRRNLFNALITYAKTTAYLCAQIFDGSRKQADLKKCEQIKYTYGNAITRYAYASNYMHIYH